jgi:hypothetical protein
MQLKKLLVLVALISTVTTQASHILGGIIQVAQTSPDSTSIGLYIASESFPPMPASVSVQKWVMNSQGKYRFIYTNCCWGPLNNSSNTSNSEVVISTDYWHVPNNTTPFMEQPLWINVEKNAVNSMKPVWGVFNCHFTNPDGDSVNLYKTEIYSSYSNGVFVPQVQSSTNVLANNDSITFVGTNLGPVGYGFQIDKYRSGYLLTTQRIQWTFIVVNSTLSIPDHKIDKKVIGVWDWQGRYIQEDIEMLPANRLYLIRYSDGTTEKILIIK